MAGILNFSRYLETLQTLTELGNTFPSSQKTIKYYVGSPGTTEGWTATIQWKTLVIDQYEVNGDGTPNFTNSRVYGYYNGGSMTQYSTGTISLPAYMYTGPILPASLVNIPITVVNISWLRGQETYDVNLALIQNWEPGVIIGNPFGGIDFEPIEPTSSTFTLTGPSQELFGITATFVATSDIPISLGSPNPAYLYRDGGILTSSTIMIGHTATFDILLPVGVYNLYAEFGGIQNYGAVTSNTLNFEVETGIPLLFDTDSIVPAKARYFSGDSITYSIRVIPDPAYTPSGEPITTTNRISIIDQAPPSSSTQFYNDRFYDGASTGSVSITSGMIDSALAWTGTVFTITSWTTNTNLFTATILVTNTSTIRTEWDQQLQGRYDSGFYSRPITLASTETRTLSINNFPLTLAVNTSRAIVGSFLNFTVGTVSTAYSRNISLFGLEQTSATQILLYSTNSSLTSGFTATVQLPYVGTWTVFASYPGDFGDSILFANRPSQSSSVQHEATAGYDLPLTFEFFRTATNDVFRVTANTSTTLTNAVSFFNSVTNFLGSATWVRSSTSSTIVIQTAPIQEVWAAPPGIIYWSTDTRAILSYRSAPDQYNTVSNSLIYQYYDGANQIQEIATASTILTTIPYYNPSSRTMQYLPIIFQYNLNRPTWENTALTEGLKPWFNFYGRAYNTINDQGYVDINQYLVFGKRGDVVGNNSNNILAISLYPDYSTSLDLSMGNDGSQRRLGGSELFWERFPIFTPGSYLYQERLDLWNWNTNLSLQDEGFTNPNVFRAWKYYDGANYNLSTSSAFIDSLDPITTGTWTVNLLQSYNLNDTRYQKGSGSKWFGGYTRAGVEAIQFADESRVYDDSLRDYGFDVYDIYRTDTIGDSRGYNVIGLNAQRLPTPPVVSSLNPKRLYFQPRYYYEWRTAEYTQSANLWFIDLVEYLGTITVTNPRKTRNQELGIDPLTTSSVHLYRFTPEVRQTNRQWRVTTPLDQHISKIPANSYQGSGRANRIAVSQKGIFKMPPNAPRWADQWVRSGLFDFYAHRATRDDPNYGRKVWVSRDTLDPAENRYTDFCNAWYGAFVECWNLLYTQEINNLGQRVPVQGTELTGNINRRWDYKGWNFAGPTTSTTYLPQNNHKIWLAATTSSVTTTTFFNTQSASLLMSTGTVDLFDNSRAFWPGTLALGLEYGQFNPQEVYILATTTFNLSSFDNISPYLPLYPKTSIDNFNGLVLQSQLPNPVQGQLNLIKVSNSQTLATQSINNDVAVLPITVSTLTTTLGTSSVAVVMQFVENFTGRIVTSNQLSLTVSNQPVTRLNSQGILPNGANIFSLRDTANLFSSTPNFFNPPVNAGISLIFGGNFNLQLPNPKYSTTNPTIIRVQAGLTFRIRSRLLGSEYEGEVTVYFLDTTIPMTSYQQSNVYNWTYSLDITRFSQSGGGSFLGTQITVPMNPTSTWNILSTNLTLQFEYQGSQLPIILTNNIQKR